jgi:ATP-dependent RNA helicase MRH4
VWAEDSLRGTDGQRGTLSKVLIFCNKRSKVDDLAAFLEKGIRNVALTGTARRGTNHHLDGFLRVKTKALAVPSSSSSDDTSPVPADFKDSKQTPHVIITSLLSRGLDFSADINHVFIDKSRNVIDFLHRAGRSGTGRVGQKGKAVVFGKMAGREPGLAKEARKVGGVL